MLMRLAVVAKGNADDARLRMLDNPYAGKSLAGLLFVGGGQHQDRRAVRVRLEMIEFVADAEHRRHALGYVARR